MRIAEQEIKDGQITPEQTEVAKHLLELAIKPVTVPDSVVQTGKQALLKEAERLKQQKK